MGVFSMLGAVSAESFDTLHSYSNTFQMPFVTPWFPEKVSKYTTDIIVQQSTNTHADTHTLRIHKFNKQTASYTAQHSSNKKAMNPHILFHIVSAGENTD